MKALQVVAFKNPPKLRELPTPEPANGELRIAVEACGLNFADLLMIKGEYQETPEPPFTLGLEMAGVVDALGDGTEGFDLGDRVAVFGGKGGLAEYTCANASLCVPLPDAMSAVDAAAFQVAYGTSHLALTERGAIHPGDKLLVLGAAGGVGLTAVEIGAVLGAEVIAVARGADKLAVAKDAGASHLIDATDPELADKLRAFKGIDIVYDPVGGDLARAAIRATARGGRYLVIGFASGDIPEFKLNHLLVKNIAVHGFYWGGYLGFSPQALQRSLSDLFDLYAQGKLRPHIGLSAPLENAPEALEKLRRRETTGKVVITMGTGKTSGPD
ncbi:MAG: NADPH:quinone oxidoreductase family protein [Pseudomonadota bacterium]